VLGQAHAAAAPNKQWDNDPNGIKVFILAGQSNMVGYGKVEWGRNPEWTREKDGEIPREVPGGKGGLRELAIHDDAYPEYDYRSLLVDPSQPETSAWKTRPDVKLWWRRGYSMNLGEEVRQGDLGPLTNDNRWFGPEYGFGQIVGDHYKSHDVLIIKTAWGGRSLTKDFRPPSAVAARGGEVGPFFKAIFTQSAEVLDQLGETFPEWAGKGYQIVGFGWHQGFSDRVNPEQSAEYRENLSDLIRDVRAGFGNPELPFVIASTGMDHRGSVEAPPYASYSAVEQAQLWSAGHERPRNVRSTDTRPFWKEAELSPNDHGYHWNYNASSYFRIGKALGDDMVALLSEPESTHFSFERGGKLFDSPAGMRAPGPYYTCLVDMKDVKDFPYDYALYFSTDHDSQEGGIWLYLCKGLPTEPGNWVSYDQALAAGQFDHLPEKPAANPIFVDRTQGRQTETPHANVIEGQVYMTYHNARAGREQSTLLATSRDGVNFARINGADDSVILDYTGGPGDGHTGYFRWGPNPFAGVDYTYVGYSLHGGALNFNSAMWGSQDAIHWDKLEVFTPQEGHAIEPDRLLIWHQIDPRSITCLGNGEYVAICSGGNRAAGPMARVSELYEIFLADDGKTLTRACRKIMGQGPADAADAEELAEATTVRIGDTWHMIYVGTNNAGRTNTVLSATGKLNQQAPKSPPLKPSERQAHFNRN